MTKVRAMRELLFMVFDTLRYNCCGTTATTQRHAQTNWFAVVPYQFTYGYQTLAWRAEVRCGISSLASLSPVFLANYFYGSVQRQSNRMCNVAFFIRLNSADEEKANLTMAPLVVSLLYRSRSAGSTLTSQLIGLVYRGHLSAP